MNGANNSNSSAISDPVRYMIFGDARAATTQTTRLRIKHDEREESARDSHRFAFACLLAFTVLLYIRPQEMFSDTFGTFPLVKIVAGVALIAYFLARVIRNEHLSIAPIELKMLGVIFMLGAAFTPLAAAPQDSFDVLFDLFIKVVAIFVLMINIINTRKRLRSMMTLVTICGAVLALFAIHSYVTGNFKMIVKSEGYVVGMRIFGPVGGIVGNPNDLATTLDMLLPLAVVLAILKRGAARAFFFACAALLVAGVVVTFSRGGFLGLIAMAAVLLWKASRRNRALMAAAFVVLLGVFVMAMPTGYAGRISTIFHIGEDPTGSSQARSELLERVATVALYHPLVGVGMGNFHIYSIREQVSHNSYLEIAAELGVAGLAAYLILIFAPLRSLRRVERETESEDNTLQFPSPNERRRREIHYMSIALQAVLVAYIVCSFFGSIEYQWFLYYPVAYAIALRQIHAAEQADSVTATSHALRKPARARGVLWRRYRRPIAQTASGSAGVSPA
ncbi:MAG TPA: O-antigen ligase family protein [Blastocatellia bacterium]|nr:O-antigen ligase family protein [Blastocatellia bacterium]